MLEQWVSNLILYLQWQLALYGCQFVSWVPAHGLEKQWVVDHILEPLCPQGRSERSFWLWIMLALAIATI